MQKLEKKRQNRSSVIKTMTVEELHEQNERVKPLIEKLNHENDSVAERKIDEKTRPSAPPPHKEPPPETAVQFLKNEGTARIFTVPKLTVSHDDSSDEVRLYGEMNVRISVSSKGEMKQRLV